MMTKGWWRDLVGRVFDQVAPSLGKLDRDNFFEVAYEHFAEAGVWELYPEVPEVLEQLRSRFQLAVISNFDGRLRLILQNLGISKYLITYSSLANSARTNPIRRFFDVRWK
jgi:putative hydrolase of the HAD superfamily